MPNFSRPTLPFTFPSINDPRREWALEVWGLIANVGGKHGWKFISGGGENITGHFEVLDRAFWVRSHRPNTPPPWKKKPLETKWHHEATGIDWHMSLIVHHTYEDDDEGNATEADVRHLSIRNAPSFERDVILLNLVNG